MSDPWPMYIMQQLQGGQGGPSVFVDGFDRDDGALGNGWTAGAGWQIVDGKLVNTPAYGDNDVVNGTFDDDSVWTVGDLWEISGGVATKTSGFDATGMQQDCMDANAWYRVDMEGTLGPGSIVGLHITQSLKAATGYAVGTLRIAGNSGTTGTIDNVRARKLSGLFAYRQRAVNALSSVGIDRSEGFTQSGHALYADDDNYIIAMTDFTRFSTQRIILLKVVAGEPTIVSNVNVAYVANAALTLSRIGTDFVVGYDGNTVISAEIDDEVFAECANWGLFSTDPVASFDNYSNTPL